MSEIQWKQGGVTFAKGFTAAGVHCGIRKNKSKRDLALIVCEKPCDAAAIYTKNRVQSAPIAVTRQHLQNGRAQAVICNSGNANTCNADGIEKALRMCEVAARAAKVAVEDVIVASTGVIGQPLPIEPIEEAQDALCQALSADGGSDAAEAILTTDTVKKEFALEFSLGGKTCRMGGIAKGSGMIHPNMATMLSFLTTDADIEPALLHEALTRAADRSFNMLSIDGDTSTNDTLAVMASGLCGNERIVAKGPEFDAFCAALEALCIALAKALAKDGEGATRLIECTVTGALDETAARGIAKSVICSSLVKAAVFGADANWGRVLCAIGYSGETVDVTRVKVEFASPKGVILVCEQGAGVDFSEELAKEILLEKEIRIVVTLGDGTAAATAWGCDLTYDYVKINGDYRT